MAMGCTLEQSRPHLHGEHQRGVVYGRLQPHLAPGCTNNGWPHEAWRVEKCRPRQHAALNAWPCKGAGRQRRRRRRRRPPELQTTTAGSPTTSRMKARSWRDQVWNEYRLAGGARCGSGLSEYPNPATGSRGRSLQGTHFVPVLLEQAPSTCRPPGLLSVPRPAGWSNRLT